MESNYNTTLNLKRIKPVLMPVEQTTLYQMNNEKSNQIDSHQLSQSHSYVAFQLKLSIFVFLFWLFVVYILSHLQLIIKIKNYFIKKCIYTPKLIRINNYWRKIVNFYFSFNITNLRDNIRSIKQLISTINNFLTQNTSLINKIYTFIIEFFYFITNIRSSSAKFLFTVVSNIKLILMLPSKIKDSILNIKRQIRQFWIQIEQIIQIVRLPIELLALIGKFCRSVAHFLHGLERPKFH